MFQLLEGLVEAGRRFASTMDPQVGAGDNKGPVGTTVALIEEGSRVYTSIHKRVHKSNRDEYAILARLIHDYMPNRYPYEAKGEDQVLLRSDFDGRVDVAPVSDPNTYSVIPWGSTRISPRSDSATATVPSAGASVAVASEPAVGDPPCAAGSPPPSSAHAASSVAASTPIATDFAPILIVAVSFRLSSRR